MTTTVTVKARAHGANVTVRNKGQANQPVEERTLEPNTESKFHLDEGQVLEVEQGAAPVPEAEELSPGEAATGLKSTDVPGRVENDKLISSGAVAKTDIDTAKA